MKSGKQLYNALKGIVNLPDSLVGTVVSVDKENNTCDIDISGIEIGEVRLQAVVKEDQKGFIIYPAIGSNVMVDQVNGKGVYRVSMYSEVEEVILKIGDHVFSINESGILFEKGEDSLKKLFEFLIDAMKQTMVLYGNNPSFNKLLQAEQINETLFR